MGLDLRLDADGFVHELVEVVFGHGGEDTVDGVLEDGVALADGDADVDVFGAFSLGGELEVAVEIPSATTSP